MPDCSSFSLSLFTLLQRERQEKALEGGGSRSGARAPPRADQRGASSGELIPLCGMLSLVWDRARAPGLLRAAHGERERETRSRRNDGHWSEGRRREKKEKTLPTLDPPAPHLRPLDLSSPPRLAKARGAPHRNWRAPVKKEEKEERNRNSPLPIKNQKLKNSQ